MSAYDQCGGGCGPLVCGSRCCAPNCCWCPRLCGPLRCSPTPVEPLCCTPPPCCPPKTDSCCPRADCTPGMVVRPIRYACCPPPHDFPDFYYRGSYKNGSGSKCCGGGDGSSRGNSGACARFGPAGVTETPVCVQYGTCTCCPGTNSC